jgi:hypothetical protein
MTPFDPANRDHVARQLYLTAGFAQHLLAVSDRPNQSLGAEATETLFDVLAILESYCGELQRLLDQGDVNAAYRARMTQAAHNASALITQMLEANPTLEFYDPNEPPCSLQEVMLNYLAHALMSFGKHTRALATVN